MKNVKSILEQPMTFFCLTLVLFLMCGCEKEIISDIQGSAIDNPKIDFSTYLDLDPEMLYNGEENDNKNLEIYFQANARFYTNVKVEGGRLLYLGNNNLNISKRLFEHLKSNLNKINIDIEKGKIEIIDSDKKNNFELISTKIPVRRSLIKTRAFEEWDDDYDRIDFRGNNAEIGRGVISAMRQYFLNDVTDMRDLVDFESTTWGQGGAIRSKYFSYNGKDVQWTVVNGTASTNYQREINSICTDECIENPEYNNYEIQIRYCEYGTALRLRTADYDTYLFLLKAVGAKK